MFFTASHTAFKPKTNIANPPINVIILAYCIATSVATVPMNNHTITASTLNPPNILGSTPPTTPWEESMRFLINSLG